MSEAGDNRRGKLEIARFQSRSFNGVPEFLYEYFGAATEWNGSTRAPDPMVDVEAAQLGSVSLIKADLAAYDVLREQQGSIQITAPLSGALCKRVGREAPVELASASGGACVSRLFERSQLAIDQATVLIVSLQGEKLLEHACLVTGSMPASSPAGIFSRSCSAACAPTCRVPILSHRRFCAAWPRRGARWQALPAPVWEASWKQATKTCSRASPSCRCFPK